MVIYTCLSFMLLFFDISVFNIFSDYINTTSINRYYEDIFEKYDITHVILKKNTKLKMLLSKDENYEEIYQANNDIVGNRE